MSTNNERERPVLDGQCATNRVKLGIDAILADARPCDFRYSDVGPQCEDLPKVSANPVTVCGRTRRCLRIPVYDVLDCLAGGMSDAEILSDFPDLTVEDIRACLAFAAERERRLLEIPAA